MQEIIGLEDLPDLASRRIFHPMKEGGLGLQSAELTAEPAQCASWAACLPTVVERLGLGSAERLADTVPRANAILDQLPELMQWAERDSLEQLEETTKRPPSQRQLCAAKVAKEVEEARCIARSVPTEGAAMNSAGGQSGGFMLLPRKARHHIADKHYRISIRLRLHMEVPRGAATCRHAGARDARQCGGILDAKGMHAVSCMTGAHLLRKHDEIKDTVADNVMSGDAMEVTHVEQVLPHAASDRAEPRLDVCVRAGNHRAQHIDVTVYSPFTVAALRAGSATRAGVAASIAEADKRRDYPGIDVIPFCLETLGRPSDSAAALVRRSYSKHSEHRAARIAEFWQDLSCVLQRHNAEAVLAAAHGSSGRWK